MRALCTSISRLRRRAARGSLARLVLVLLALSLVFANGASAAMPLGGASQDSASAVHCHVAQPAAKHACGDPRAPCCTIACDCWPAADLAVAPVTVDAEPALSACFSSPRDRFAASMEARPLRPPIA